MFQPCTIWSSSGDIGSFSGDIGFIQMVAAGVKCLLKFKCKYNIFLSFEIVKLNAPVRDNYELNQVSMETFSWIVF